MRRHKPPSLLSRARPCGPPRGAQLGAACRHACCLYSRRRPSSVVEFGFEKKSRGGRVRRCAKHTQSMHQGCTPRHTGPSVSHWKKILTWCITFPCSVSARARAFRCLSAVASHRARSVAGPFRVRRLRLSLSRHSPASLVALLVCVPWGGGWPCRNPLLRGGKTPTKFVIRKTKKEEKRDAGGMQAARGRDSWREF